MYQNLAKHVVTEEAIRNINTYKDNYELYEKPAQVRVEPTHSSVPAQVFTFTLTVYTRKQS